MTNNERNNVVTNTEISYNHPNIRNNNTDTLLLYSTTPLSFWGGVHPQTGRIIDVTHPLYGNSIENTILCIPSGRGSCTGSQVLLELILNGKAPYAIILRDVDSILCTGAIVAEEFFFNSTATTCTSSNSSSKDSSCSNNGMDDHHRLSSLSSSPPNLAVVDEDDCDEDNNRDGSASAARPCWQPSSITTQKRVPIIVAVGETNFARLKSHNDDDSVSVVIDDDDEANVCIIISSNCNNKLRIRTPNLLRFPITLSWEDLPEKEDSRNSLPSSSSSSLAEQLAKRTISRIASVSSSSGEKKISVIPITSAHIDAVTYIGRGGLLFVQKLVELGGRVKVTTTLNSQSCDRRRWSQLGVDTVYAQNANAVGDAYVQLGCEPMSFTCAPYLLPTRPGFGENIIWGESNAVVYSNSVIGARTEKYADYFDILAAIVGYVPYVGVHIESNRAPTIVIDATRIIQDHVIALTMNSRNGNSRNYKEETEMRKAKNALIDYYQNDIDSLFPVMGWICGNLSDGSIPLILGFDLLDEVSDDDLKAFCAAFGTTGTAPLFHMANVTPEAMGDERVRSMMQFCGERRVEITKDILRKSYMTLDGGALACGDDNDMDGQHDRISLVALGNPHLSLKELGTLSSLIDQDSRPKNKSVNIIATLGRYVQSEGEKLGYIQKLSNFGVQFINDTCWCMLTDPPIIPLNPDATIVTNSGKYAHYGPGLTNRKVRFGSMYQCINASRSGKMTMSNNGERGHNHLPRWLRSFSTWNNVIRFMKK